FPASQLIAPESVIIRAEDGAEIHGQIFKGSAGDNPRAALVFVHDGPAQQSLLGWHYLNDHGFAYALNQYFVSRGFLVLSLNYRSGIGYGHAYQHPKLVGASEFDDLVSAVRYLRTRPDVDPKRLGIWGMSYGGFLAAAALARNSRAFASGVDIEGPPEL